VPIVRRYLEAQVRRDLRTKMVFVAGPRQVGKTTLAKSLPGATRGYLSWDIPEHRDRILRGQLPPSALWIFDEIHKYRAWRGFLQGIFDSRRPAQQILLTDHVGRHVCLSYPRRDACYAPDRSSVMNSAVLSTRMP